MKGVVIAAANLLAFLGLVAIIACLTVGVGVVAHGLFHLFVLGWDLVG